MFSAKSSLRSWRPFAKTLKLVVWAFSLNFLHDSTLFVIDIHQNMPISLILTPFDYFQIRPTFAVTPNLILEPCPKPFLWCCSCCTFHKRSSISGKISLQCQNVPLWWTSIHWFVAVAFPVKVYGSPFGPCLHPWPPASNPASTPAPLAVTLMVIHSLPPCDTPCFYPPLKQGARRKGGHKQLPMHISQTTRYALLTTLQRGTSHRPTPACMRILTVAPRLLWPLVQW